MWGLTSIPLIRSEVNLTASWPAGNPAPNPGFESLSSDHPSYQLPMFDSLRNRFWGGYLHVKNVLKNYTYKEVRGEELKAEKRKYEFWCPSNKGLPWLMSSPAIKLAWPFKISQMKEGNLILISFYSPASGYDLFLRWGHSLRWETSSWLRKISGQEFRYVFK